MENVEVPEYFTCPISLQIMKDPVTAISGITYDRESIEHWLYNNHNTICPVTNQPLPQNSDLTPNHTLRRLIQSWCTLYAVDRIPTPKTPLSKFRLINLLKDLRVPTLRLQTLNKLEAHATESDRNRVHMVEAGVPKSLLNIIVSCYRKEEISSCLEGALNVLYLIRVPLIQSGSGLPGNDEVVDSLTWVLGLDCFGGAKTAAYTLKIVVKFNPRVLERLNRVFFQTMSRGLQRGGVGVNAILHVLLEACAWGRNRGMMIESGTVFDVIELELRESDNRRTTEMVLGIVYHLCSCADGRAQLLGHAAGMAAVTRRILKVSATADDRAVLIIWLIAKYSATSGVLAEMLRVGSVAKMCVVIQADREAHLKEKAREILRMHFDVWKNSPCVEIATFTRYMK